MSLGTGILNLPERKAQYRFRLTPLADAMFQLLIFFMLSSSLTPYSLLTLKSSPETLTADDGSDATRPTDAPEGNTQAGAQASAALWTVEPGQISIRGQDFALDAVGEVAEALVAGDPGASVVLIVRSRATVQDITSVLEALRSAGIASIQVTTGSL